MIKFVTLSKKKVDNTLFCPPTKLGKIVLCTLFVSSVLFLSFWSLFDKDPTISESENRALAAAPKFSIEAVFDKSFTANFDEYYSDTFPFREFFISVNTKISNVFSETKGTDDIVLVEKGDKDDFAGQDID